MRKIVPVSTHLLDTKGRDLRESLKRRHFMKLSVGSVAYASIIPLVGCAEDQPQNTGMDTAVAPDTSTTDDIYADTGQTFECEVEFPAEFKCDDQSEAGVKHTPQLTNFADSGTSYDFSILVPHVVNADHHIIGCQVVAFDPLAEAVHSFIDYHYYTPDYILTADDMDWAHDFAVDKAAVPTETTHLLVFSICNKHGNYGVVQTV